MTVNQTHFMQNWALLKFLCEEKLIYGLGVSLVEPTEDFIEKKDKKRKRYHNYHVKLHWGDSRLYDLTVNSSRLGIEKTIDFLECYIKARMGE